jgi:hypothetical protein
MSVNGAAGLEGLFQRWRSGTDRSKAEFARALGYTQGISMARFFDERKFGARPLPEVLIKRLLNNVVGTGDPPITAKEIINLGGISALPITEDSRNIIATNAALLTGCFIPVLSIGQIMGSEIQEGETQALSPPEHVLSDRELDGDEFAIWAPDDGMDAPVKGGFPKGSLVIVREGAAPMLGHPALLKITHADGSVEAAIRTYVIQEYTPDGTPIGEFRPLNNICPKFVVRPPGEFPLIEVKGRVVEVRVTIRF